MSSDRKLTHLEICREREVRARRETTHLDDVMLVHDAAPELSLSEIDLETSLFGKTLAAPILISAMTGGHPATKKINESLAEAAQSLGIGMCVGSQRAAIEDPRMGDSFRVVRDISREMLVVGNIGAPQLLSDDAVDYAQRAVDMIGADALAVHLNPLQEIVQPGGDTKYRGVLDGLERITRALKVPVVVKETGCGISSDVARSLVAAGAAAIDVAGLGGTSWAAVEHYNALMSKEEVKAHVAETFWDWGIPTAMSIWEVASLKSGATLIASGGITNGVDVAKSIALGADLAGIARPLLKPAYSGAPAVRRVLEGVIYELKVASMLTGSRSVSELKSARFYLRGDLLGWIAQSKAKAGTR